MYLNGQLGQDWSLNLLEEQRNELCLAALIGLPVLVFVAAAACIPHPRHPLEVNGETRGEEDCLHDVQPQDAERRKYTE